MQSWDKFLKIKHAQSEDVQELLNKLVDDVRNVNEELTEYTNTPSWNFPNSSYDDDDDEESSIPLKDIIMSGLPPLIEDLVQIPSESEDSSDGECDLPPYDDSSKNRDLTFSNPLFDIDEHFTSSDESFSEEDVPNENFKIFSNPLFDLDEEITSTKVDQIDDEVLENTNSIPPGIEYPCFNAESDLLESLLHQDTSNNDSQKIDSLLDEFADELTLLHSIPPGIDDVNLYPEGEFVFENSTIDVVEDIPVDVPNILPTHPSFQLDFDFITSYNDLGSDLDNSYPSGDRNKIYDPGICIEVTRFLSTLSPVIDTLLPFSSENENKVFNHGVLASKEKSPPSSSHRGFKTSKLSLH
ncbi:hypothetical protein Tco_0194239 [Tanacetum coccineum]